MATIKRLLLTIVLVVASLAATAATGTAATFLHHGTTTGNVLSAGQTYMAGSTSTSATIAISSLGTITCTSAPFDATVGASGGASVTTDLVAMTLTGCTDTFPVITFTSCHLAVQASGTIVATSHTAGTVTWNTVYLRCNVAGGGNACYYLMNSAAGSFADSGATLGFANVGVTHSVPTGGTGDLGSSLCGTVGLFGVSYNDITTNTGATLVVNQNA